MWRIYYDDGTVRDWTQGFEGLEPYGVICILQTIPHNNGLAYHVNYGAPYYAFDDDEWIVMQVNDVEDRLAHGIPMQYFLIGRAVSRRKFLEIYNKAQADKDAENL